MGGAAGASAGGASSGGASGDGGTSSGGSAGYGATAASGGGSAGGAGGATSGGTGGGGAGGGGGSPGGGSGGAGGGGGTGGSGGGNPCDLNHFKWIDPKAEYCVSGGGPCSMTAVCGASEVQQAQNTGISCTGGGSWFTVSFTKINCTQAISNVVITCGGVKLATCPT